MEQKFKIKIEDGSTTYAKVVIEPLQPGFGQTLGNSLRRVMLGYLRGAAVTSVKISGTTHQFATLKGMKEDVVEFVLNVKQLQVGYSGDEPVTVRLKTTGPGEITAGQIDLVNGVDIANKDLVLAHLADEKSKLDVQMTVESGVGYSPAEDRRTETVGEIPLDAVFSPVVRVNYHVSSTRVGRMTNFDKLSMEVFTNGTLSPEEAVREAATILRDSFELVVNPVAGEDETVVEQPRMTENNEVMRLTVEELELPTRIANALRKSGLGTVKALLEAPKEEIMKVKNLGNKSLSIISDALKVKGIDFS